MHATATYGHYDVVRAALTGAVLSHIARGGAEILRAPASTRTHKGSSQARIEHGPGNAALSRAPATAVVGHPCEPQLMAAPTSSTSNEYELPTGGQCHALSATPPNHSTPSTQLPEAPS